MYPFLRLPAGAAWTGWLMAAWLTAGSAHGQALDRILPTSGSPLEGTIESTAPTHLTLDTRAGERRISVEDIKMIRFGGEPPQLTRAKTALEEGQYDVVLQEINKVNPRDVERPIIQQELAFLHAMATAKLGQDVEGAARQMAGFLKSNSQTYHYFEAMETLGDLLMQMGRFPNAAESFARLGQAPWPTTKVRAAVREAQALQAQGPEKYSQALQRYEQVINTSAAGQEIDRQKQLARVGRAVCRAELGEVEAAIADLHDVINTGDYQDVELFARANNALGACYLKLGQKKDAELRYLQTDLNFFQDSPSHAEALYHLSQISRELGHADRALSAQRRLKSQYAASPWARR